MSKNVNNDVSMNPPRRQLEYSQSVYIPILDNQRF